MMEPETSQTYRFGPAGIKVFFIVVGGHKSVKPYVVWRIYPDVPVAGVYLDF